MSVIRVGISGTSGVKRQKVYAELDVLELIELGDPVPPPKRATIDRWRSEAPDRFQLVVVAPATVLETMRIAASETALLAEQVEALQAPLVLYPSSADLAPERANEAAIVETLKATPGGAQPVWEAHGLWTYPRAQQMAAAAGAILAVDPLNLKAPYDDSPAPPPPPGTRAYFRLPVVPGLRERFSDWHLEEIADLASGYDECWVVFAHTFAKPDATRFKKLVSSAD